MNFWQQVIDGIEIVTMEVILAVAPIVILFVLMIADVQTKEMDRLQLTRQKN